MPRAARTAVGDRLAQTERPLAAAELDTGVWLVATDRALRAAGDERPDLWWDEIDRATWGDGVLRVQRVTGSAERRYRLRAPGRVPEVVRERVTASIVVSERYRLSTGGQARVVGRRRVGVGGLRWMVVFDAAGDAADPLARAEADSLLAAARERSGSEPLDDAGVAGD